ncbi:FtsQ-type POTRA domain-containing protein [Actinoplanes sp. NPDC051633]|uniref:cell division protein FtsQ/DivIB n=1 Tax=Actinoplanes sp. NPDC051633 TaxID=3155670 RepID=UPI00341F661A
MAGGGGRNWRLVRADTDAVPSSVRRFMARARQRRLRALLPWAVGAGVVLVIGGLLWMVYATPVLGVREVRVVGADVLTAEQVQEAAAVPMREPLARVDLDAVRTRVQNLAPVDHAVVSRSWPASVVVEVVERTPVAAVRAGKKYTLVDDEGVPYRSVARKPAGIPIAELAKPAPDDVNTKAMLTVLGSLTEELREQLLQISVPAPARIELLLRKERKVVWGDDSASDTKAQVSTALLRRDGRIIDVSAPAVVTIR